MQDPVITGSLPPLSLRSHGAVIRPPSAPVSSSHNPQLWRTNHKMTDFKADLLFNSLIKTLLNGPKKNQESGSFHNPHLEPTIVRSLAPSGRGSFSPVSQRARTHCLAFPRCLHFGSVGCRHQVLPPLNLFKNSNPKCLDNSPRYKIKGTFTPWSCDKRQNLPKTFLFLAYSLSRRSQVIFKFDSK